MTSAERFSVVIRNQTVRFLDQIGAQRVKVCVAIAVEQLDPEIVGCRLVDLGGECCPNSGQNTLLIFGGRFAIEDMHAAVHVAHRVLAPMAQATERPRTANKHRHQKAFANFKTIMALVVAAKAAERIDQTATKNHAGVTSEARQGGKHVVGRYFRGITCKRLFKPLALLRIHQRTKRRRVDEKAPHVHVDSLARALGKMLRTKAVMQVLQELRLDVLRVATRQLVRVLGRAQCAEREFAPLPPKPQRKPDYYRLEPVWEWREGDPGQPGIVTAAIVCCAITGRMLAGMGGPSLAIDPNLLPVHAQNNEGDEIDNSRLPPSTHPADAP